MRELLLEHSEGAADVVRKAERYGARLGSTTGNTDAEIRAAIKLGISKINTDTDLRLALTAGIRKALAEEPENFDPRKYLAPARELVKEGAFIPFYCRN